MSRTFAMNVVAVLALGTAVQLYAQEASKAPVTVTGCLQKADATHARASSGAAGTSGSESFVLTDVHRGGDVSTPSADAPASKTHGSKGPWLSVAGDLDRLQEAAGHRVEINGRIETLGSIVGTSASETDGPSGTIHVAALKVTNETCR